MYYYGGGTCGCGNNYSTPYPVYPVYPYYNNNSNISYK